MKAKELEYTDGAPTFKAPDGRGYHIKRLVGNTARFYPQELEAMMQNPDKSNVILIDDAGSGKLMPSRVLAESPAEWGGFKLTYQEPRVDGIGINGDIVLKLSRRTAESKHYRINYIPMESLLVYNGFDTHLKKSVGSTGKLDMFLIMSPQAIAPD